MQDSRGRLGWQLVRLQQCRELGKRRCRLNADILGILVDKLGPPMDLGGADVAVALRSPCGIASDLADVVEVAALRAGVRDPEILRAARLPIRLAQRTRDQARRVRRAQVLDGLCRLGIVVPFVTRAACRNLLNIRYRG